MTPMDPNQPYFELNREAWNRKTEVHLHSDFYDQQAFLQGKNTLNPIERNLLGDVTGLRILHLQCHFGQDSISLARLGAQVTGVDLSDTAITLARQLTSQTQTDAQFVCCNVYDLLQQLHEKFDLVFTSYGTIGWLPDLQCCAQVIAHFLKPNGRFVFVEFHPVVLMFDNDFKRITYRYFNSGPLLETETGTYADPAAELTLTTVGWNHGLAEVLSPLLQNGLALRQFEEFDYSPYPCFKHTEAVGPRQYRIKHLGNQLPMVYALVAEKVG